MSDLVSIAVVDDDEVHQFTFKKQIEFAKISNHIITFPDGEEAIHHFRENFQDPEQLPDVLFLDINMPIMDGWDFIEAYTELHPKLSKSTSIFMVSSSIREDDIRRAKSFDLIKDYIVKPISTQALVNLVKTL